MKPRIADLFCGAGGAGMGLHRAGFKVVGFDIADQPHYPFEFHKADALTVDLSGFDAVWASPPCQAYTTMNNRWGSDSPELIHIVRRKLEAASLPFLIENVMGARNAMHEPIRLTGEMFGLGVHRPRLFESNVFLLAPPPHRRNKKPVAVYGKDDQRRLWTRSDGSMLRAATFSEACDAMGIDWMIWEEITQAIPPAYSEFLGRQLMCYLNPGS